MSSHTPSVRANEYQRLRPDDARLADAAAGLRSAYVHVPFCLHRCPYCDFAIVDESSEGRSDVDRYVAAVVAEIGMEAEFGPLDAVNFGGGTPTRLSAEQLGSIVGAIETRFGFSDSVEISLEANPEDWTPELAVGLVDVGFNRVSIGAQSFDDAVLGALGRSHDAGTIASTVESARNAGIPSVSLDLIFGHPSESDASWDHSLRSALDLGPDHMSTYSLTVEPGTTLSREVLAGAPAPDPDTQASRYERFAELAGREGPRPVRTVESCADRACVPLQPRHVGPCRVRGVRSRSSRPPVGTPREEPSPNGPVPRRCRGWRAAEAR